MGTLINCIDGPELAKRLNKAMGKRETDKARLKTFSSNLRDESEDIRRLLDETGSSFEWLRHLQTALLGERTVLVAMGWNRQQNCEGVWMWEQSEKDRLFLIGLTKAQAAEVLTERIIPHEQTSSLRLDPLKNSGNVWVPLLTERLVADERWSGDFNSRKEHDRLTGAARPYAFGLGTV